MGALVELADVGTVATTKVLLFIATDAEGDITPDAAFLGEAKGWEGGGPDVRAPNKFLRAGEGGGTTTPPFCGMEMTGELCKPVFWFVDES